MSFLVRKISFGNEFSEILNLGFDSEYLDVAVKKYQFGLFKISNVSPWQATIIKQLALSLGTDAAVHRDVIKCAIDSSDVLLAGSVSQLLSLCKKLKKQPFGLSKLSEKLENQLKPTLPELKIRNTIFDWNKKTYLMGILNVTPDSFSDGGLYFDKKSALQKAQEISEYADIIDIGAESTRPNAEPVEVEEEIGRLIPVIEAIRQVDDSTPISVDTRNVKTAEKALQAGADMINDVSGLGWDADMARVLSEHGSPVVIMHSLGNAVNLAQEPDYQKNIVDEVYSSLTQKIDYAIDCGIKKSNIIIDVGIGFDKTFEHNIELLSRMDEFSSLGCAVLAGVSRKSVVKSFAGEDIQSRDETTLALSAYLVAKKINILRVHNSTIHKAPLELINKLVRR